MNRFPFSVTPLPDELLLSYILRTIAKNEIDLDVFEKYCARGRLFDVKKLSFDDRHAFLAFFQSLPFKREIDAGEFFLSLSTFRFRSVFMIPEKQMRYINNVFRKQDELNTPLRMPLQTINYCKACAAEDIAQYNTPYLHRNHHLPGVCFCPKHHIRLQTFYAYDDQKEEFLYHPIESSIPEEDLVAYADYAQALLLSNVQSDFRKVKEVIFEEFAWRDYRPYNSYHQFFVELRDWQHRALFDPDVFSCAGEGSNIWLSAIDNKPPENILGLLMFLFPDPQELIEQISTERDLIHTYTCPACNTTYYASPLAQETGFGCPKCDENLSYTERYGRIVQELGRGEYELKGNYVSNGKHVQLHHNSCGKDVFITPQRFIYDRARCTFCRKKHHNADYYRWA